MNLQLVILLLMPLIGGWVSYVTRVRRWTFAGSSLGVLIVFLFGIYSLITESFLKLRFDWLPQIQLGWQLDKMALLMILLVSGISFLVHIFSIAYMEEDRAQSRYFAFLGFFTFSMIGLLLADHLLLLFIFWELVGFSSYLLIGFWWQQPNNAYAARYAFVTNRIADTALISGILWMLYQHDLSFLSEMNQGIQVSTFISVLLVIGAFGKSAQGPFFTWLPRAMAGPTPVSALIHAATMVAAGVYLLIRIFPVLSEQALLVVAIIGAFTALLGAISALTSYDIKRVLAFSTISQLGYMIIGIGVGAPEAAFFHLWTHAFFKAGLFLSAGAVIHYMHYLGHHLLAQDLRAMGGIRHPLKMVFYAYTVCMLALAGLPFLTGFISKEAIILQSLSWSSDFQLGFLIPIIALIAAALTAFYMVRHWLYVFFGQYRGEHLTYHFREKWTLWLPVGILALSSVAVWYNWNPLGHEIAFLDYLFSNRPKSNDNSWLMPVSIVIAIAGMAYGYFRYRGLMDQRRSVEIIREEFDRSRTGLLSLSYHAFYVDSFYTRLISPVFIQLARACYWFDKKIIDRLIHSVGISTVLLSKAVDLIDKLLVDGLVNMLGNLQVWIGNFIRLFHANRVQLHFFWAILLLILVIIGFEIF